MRSPRIQAYRPGPVMLASASLTTFIWLAPNVRGLGNSSMAGDPPRSGPGITNHPVGIVPSAAITVPEGWPLDPDGAITCRTCHAGPGLSSPSSPPRLRGSESDPLVSTDFCAKCHGQLLEHSAKALHWLALGTAHLSSRREGAPGPSRSLDHRSRQCLSCHDGVSATESDNLTPWSRARGYSGDQRRNHPIGISYRRTHSKDLSPLRPLSMLPREVELPEGKVGCCSCHNLFAGTRYLLSVSIQGSQLCLTCHDMR